MDYGKKKIDKCVIEGKILERDWENMNEYYRKIYPKLIDQLEKEAPITTKAK